MPRGKQETAAQIIPKLGVVEVEVARGKIPAADTTAASSQHNHSNTRPSQHEGVTVNA